MDKAQSLYLDCLRFAAAMVVFLSHAASQKISGGIFWQLKEYDQTAVMIFFVMSGFVIAFVTKERENTIAKYSVARISRLYSIVLPALLLTYIADSIGLAANPDFYLGGPWSYSLDNQLLDYLMSFFLINNIWGLYYTPGINGPFWSLTFEFFYYLLFATVFYYKSNAKYLVALVLALIAGPTIIALLPIWLMGYWLFYSMESASRRASNVKAFICLMAMVLMVVGGPYVREVKVHIPYVYRPELLGDYFDAILFTVHLYYAPYALKFFQVLLMKFEKPIRWAASLTFALYLFHRPLIQLFGALSPVPVDNWYYRLTMLFGTMFIIGTFGYWCERQKVTLKTALNKLVWTFNISTNAKTKN
jgi:peptidoglycan/LPS O-acetylase OafA/YrhL